MAVSEQHDDIIEVIFTHPHDSTMLKVCCSTNVTAKQAIQELTKLSFLEAHERFLTYAVVLRGNRLIPSNATFESVGVRDGDTLSIILLSME